jgi:hypothetical protein
MEMSIPARSYWIKHSKVYSTNPAMHFLAFLVLLSGAMAATAGEIQRAEVHHKDGVYTLDLSVVVSSRFDPVYIIVTDYEQLHRISEVLVETALLSKADAEVKRRRLVTKTCILIFCFTAKMVEDVWEVDNSIITKIIPEQSDYKFGKTVWRVNSVDDEHSRIQLFCELEPDFWIPPFIGPYLLKRKMMSEAKKTINRIEELTASG